MSAPIWHWAACEKCGDVLHLREGELVDSARGSIGSRCCGSTFPRGEPVHDTLPVHAIADAIRPPVLCGSCGYEKEFGAMPKGQKNGHAEEHAPSTGAIELDRYEEKLPIKLDDAVVAARGVELAHVIEQRDVVLEERREANARYREQLAGFNERMKELAEQVNGKIEKKNVVCVDYLLPTNEVQTVRTDTGEIVETRAATPEELQQEIPGAGKRNPRKSSQPEGEAAQP